MPCSVGIRPRPLASYHAQATAIIVRSIITLSLFCLAHGSMPLHAQPHRLRVATINVWSGLDYSGTLRMGEYETEAQRDARFDVLVSRLRALDPDVLFVQEANPVPCYTRQLACALGMESIHQTVLGGIRIGPVGIPTNLRQGNAILARPGLRLEEYGSWKLSGSFGLHGDVLSFHLDEANFVLGGKIVIDGIPVILLNMHFSSRIPLDDVVRDALARWLRTGFLTADEHASMLESLEKDHQRKVEEARQVREILDALPPDVPVIAGGDLNSAPESDVLAILMDSGALLDTRTDASCGACETWDGERNPNILIQLEQDYPGYPDITPTAWLSRSYDASSYRIDYILLGDHFTMDHVVRSGLFAHSASQGVYASDHYGWSADILLDSLRRPVRRESGRMDPLGHIEWDVLPILMYDTDIGFGYGLKGKLVNAFGLNESFDVTAFNSTKGERWYRVAASFPDAELRQGKSYGFALDAAIDYDKLIKNSFFGVGGDSRFDAREYYTREPLEFTLAFSRAFTSSVVATAGLSFKSIRNFGFEPGSRLALLSPAANAGTVRYASLNAGFRFDTRNSFVQPSSGVVLETQAHFVPPAFTDGVSWTRLSAAVHYYTTLFYPQTVLATRLMGSTLLGDDLPVQVMQSLGGNRTLRGSPQDRYLDRTIMLCNTELRFPIWWRFGGIFGIDAGNVWSAPSKLGVARWKTNLTAGLRFAMDTFIVRLDVGFGHETTGFYFNFDHIF